MTEMSELCKFVHTRMTETFGEATSTLGRDDHWALKPSEFKAAINVLVDGANGKSAVWVFDPHSRDDGVMRELITSEEQVEALIRRIQDRVSQVAGNGSM